MNKLIIAALTASVLATPAMAAPDRHYNNGQRGHADQRFENHGHQRKMQHHRWNRGERFDYRRAHNYRVIANAHRYHLRPAPRGYRWVQSGNDAVLIAITSGVIASVLANAIH